MHRITLGDSLSFAALAVLAAAFYLFSYNSGYGYDALEYLVLGRALAEGVPMYTYLPSKSPGIYYFVAGLHRLGVDFDHVSLAAVITALYVCTVVATYLVARRWFSLSAATAIAVLTALAAPFMELNFLQPTSLFYLCGLLAFDALLRFERSPNHWYLFAAGAALGVGIAIKSSAAFYGLAAGHFLIMLWAREKSTFASLCLRGTALAAGTIAVLALLLAYYATQGKAQDFIDWTFAFPFAHYPSSTTYLAKAYTKLLWINLFIIGCLPLLLSASVRKQVYSNNAAVLAGLFGICASLALLKTQASHYFFPGAPFLCMFAVAVYEQKVRTFQISKSLVVGGGVAAGLFAVALAASVAFYRPDAIRRLTAIKDFAAEERPMREFVQSKVRENQFVLITGGMLGSTWTYWISHRYPPPPFVNADVKTIWMLRNQPAQVLDVLDNPKLALVQFEPTQVHAPLMEDVFGNLPKDKLVMGEYLARLQTKFLRLSGEPSVIATFWRPCAGDC